MGNDRGRGTSRLAAAGAAEITGSVAGVVKDASGAALAGATVVVRGGAEFGTPTDYFPGREIQVGARWSFGR